jgi:hypothetical protein
MDSGDSQARYVVCFEVCAENSLCEGKSAPAGVEFFCRRSAAIGFWFGDHASRKESGARLHDQADKGQGLRAGAACWALALDV